MHHLFQIINNYRSIAITGICKNAGKTTVLKRCIKDFSQAGKTVALTSIGRDGEKRDIVTGTNKPGLYVRRGTLLATARGLLESCDVTREILMVSDISTPLGDIVLMRALSDGKVQIAGPSVVEQLDIITDAFVHFGAERILIDGAVDRKSLTVPALADAAILCAGASCGDSIKEVVEKTAYVCELMTLPEAPGKAFPPEFKYLLCGAVETALSGEANLVDWFFENGDNRIENIYINGALTDRLAAQLLRLDREGMNLVAADPSKILLTKGAYDKLRKKGFGFMVQEKTNLAAVAVNPFSVRGQDFDKNIFMERMAGAVSVPVVNAEEIP